MVEQLETDGMRLLLLSPIKFIPSKNLNLGAMVKFQKSHWLYARSRPPLSQKQLRFLVPQDFHSYLSSCLSPLIIYAS